MPIVLSDYSKTIEGDDALPLARQPADDTAKTLSATATWDGI
tara:strand:- start:866 stop:991 length:126 start_codon:yes stop_codon:yes gene_type:complete